MRKRLLLSLFIFATSYPLHAQGLDSHFRGQENAVWAGSIFLRGFDPTTHERLTNEKGIAFADRLKRNGVRYVYVFAGPYQKDGHLPEYAFSEQARSTIALLKGTYPSLKILPWIGGIEDKTVHLEKAAWLETSVREAARLMASIPFDGVHIDFEYVLFPEKSASTTPIDQYDSAWVKFHEKLRDRLPKAFISTVVVSSAPGTRPWKHKHEMRDLLEISRKADQVAFMYYETHLREAALYRENMRLQLRQISQMKKDLASRAPEYLFGIGTFKSEKALKSYRDMRFENVSTTLRTLSELLDELSPSERLIDGLAIYGEWTTTKADWAQIRKLWVSPHGRGEESSSTASEK
jgi:hypothetical protein